MKKSLVVLFLLVFAVTGAFAQGFSMSIGAGGLFDWSLSNGIEVTRWPDKDYIGIRNMSFGGFIFFDATYVELEVSFAYGLITDVSEIYFVSHSELKREMLQAGAVIMLKYPFAFGKLTFFPLIGGSYNMVFVEKDKDGHKTYDSVADCIDFLSQYGFLGGIGFDINFTKSVFLRIETLYHVRFAGKAQRDSAELLNTMAKLAATGENVSGTLGMGPRAKIGIGFKF